MATDNRGTCPKCFTANDYNNIVCDGCGARLPWADAVSTKSRQTTVLPGQTPPTQAIAPTQPTTPAPVPTHIPPAPTVVWCASCGRQNDPDASFCQGCGLALTGAPAPAQQRWSAQPYQPAPQQHVNVNVKQSGGGSGWCLATILLLFFTPIGCITWPVFLFFLFAFLAALGSGAHH